MEAATVANAMEFISSSHLELAFEDSGHSLFLAFKEFKSELIAKIGEAEYTKKLGILEALSKKEQDEGKF